MSARVADPEAPKLSRVQLPALDGVRGVAVLLVMLHNLTILERRGSMSAKVWVLVTDAGWIGVQLFFVLSGFLITGILLDELGADRRGGPGYFRNFYVRRALRIFPLYYLVLVGRFWILPHVLPDVDVPAVATLGFWFYLSNWTELSVGAVNGFGHFWSLAVEEQFYLVWPLAVAKLSRRGLVYVCIALIVASGLARIAVYATHINPHWLYMSTVTRADALALGALVAIAIRDARARAWVARYHLRIGAAAVVVMLAIMAYAHGLSRFEIFVETVGYSTLAVLFAAGIARIALDGLGLAERGAGRGRARPRWAMHPWLRAAGKYSYAAYVFHPLIKVGTLYFAHDWLLERGVLDHWWRDAIFVIACGAASFALARVSYAAIEGPLMRLKDRWAPRGDARTSASAART